MTAADSADPEPPADPLDGSDITERLPPTRVVVIGAGAAGLVAAWDLARPGFAVTLIEASDHAGGSVLAHDVGGMALDVGAESFATRGGAVEELLADLRLTDRIARPNPAGAWLHLAGRSVPLPSGGILGIPASPLARDVVAAIGWRGALRAYLDRLIPVMKIGREDDLARLVSRRMGRAVLDGLVAPIVTGVYSTAVDDLDIEAVLPGLNGALTRAGSLSGAIAELRLDAARGAGSSSKPGSAVLGLRGGMHVLTDRLADEVRSRGCGIRLRSRAVALRRPAGEDGPPAEQGRNGGTTWRIDLADGETIGADAVVLAVSGPEALEILRTASADAARLGELGWPEPTAVDITTLVLDQPALDSAPRGTRLLVARDPGGRGVVGGSDGSAPVKAKAATHSNAKWPWLARELAEHRHILRLSYGRAGGAARPWDDTELRAQALADAAALFGVPVTESMVVGFDHAQWRMPPTLVRGRRSRLDALSAVVAGLDGVEVTGAWVTGTGLASVVPGARQAARRIRGLRWKALTESLPGTAGGS
jgi:oxygen-dependent protoporphyrinogen oxidase